MTALTPQQSFEERIKERIRESIGELMPDEALAQIVARGVEDAFFKERLAKDRYGYETHTEPAWIVRFLRNELEKQVREATEKWFADNAERVGGLLREILDGSILSVLGRAINSVFREPMDALRSEMEARISAITKSV